MAAVAEIAAATYASAHPFSLKGTDATCKVVQCHDGDTVHVALVLFGKVQRIDCRLDGIDTPEMNVPEQTPAALLARARLLELCTTCRPADVAAASTTVQLQRVLDKNTKLLRIVLGDADKYGRWLAKLFVPETGACVNEILVQEGLAHRYDGGTKALW